MKAVLKNGVVYPKEAVPADWPEGTELEVEKAISASTDSVGTDLDHWYAELSAACSQMDSEDDRTLPPPRPIFPSVFLPNQFANCFLRPAS